MIDFGLCVCSLQDQFVFLFRSGIVSLRFGMARKIVLRIIQAVYYGKPMKEVVRMTNCEVRILEL